MFVVVAAGLRMVSVGVDSGLLTPRGRYLPGVDAQAVLVTSPEHLSLVLGVAVVTSWRPCLLWQWCDYKSKHFKFFLGVQLFKTSRPQPRRQQLHLWYLSERYRVWPECVVLSAAYQSERKSPSLPPSPHLVRQALRWVKSSAADSLRGDA